MAQLGINIGFLIVQIIVFIIVFLTLNAWVYRPFVELMDKRRKTIAQGLEDARVASDARFAAEKEAEEIQARANQKAAQIVAEAKDRAETAAREVKAASDAEAARGREKALAEIEEERNRVLGDLRGEVAALAIAAAQKLVGESLDEKRQHALIDEFFAGMKSGRVAALGDAGLAGDSAVVTSALPLTKSEQEAVQRDVLSKVGAKAVTFKVDPSILGGLVVKVGDKVLDGSVAGRIEGLRQSLR